MKIYVVHHRAAAGESAGRTFHGNKAEAEKAQREQPENDPVEKINVTPTKAGILAALNHWGSHNDNG